jgi:hypothetical protein
MWKDVAKAWDYQESEISADAFDPLINLLLNACSVEFEKINQELHLSRERILEQLVHTLVPEILTGPSPAHGILHVRPVEAELKILPTHQFYNKKKAAKTEKEIYFSALEEYKLTNATVRYLATGDRLLNVENFPFREVIAQSDTRTRTLPTNEVWLGISLHSSIQSIRQMAFFINWKNESKLQHWLRQLPFTQWHLGPHPLVTELGLLSSAQPLDASFASPPFEQEYQPTYHVQRAVKQIWQPHFVTLKGINNGKEVSLQANKTSYPSAFEQVFPLEELAKMQDPLLWLRIEFPQYVPASVLVNMDCQLNCFPVLNRKFYSKSARLSDFLNIVPLKCDEYFFDIARVVNDQGLSFHNTPLANLRNLDTGSFTLRNRGIKKTDYRAASQVLRHLLDLMRDESAAFAAYHSDFLSQKTKKLHQDITDLEQHIKENDRQWEENAYLLIKPTKNEKNKEVVIEFWSTDGEDANGIPAGANLEMYTSKGFHRDSLRLITSTGGGRNSRSSTESYYEFKKALVSRDRVVTQEDIKTFCYAHFGDKISGVSISKGFQVSEKPGEGMQRTIEVTLLTTAGQEELDNNSEWESACRDLEINLNCKSAGLLPIRVKARKADKPF